MEEVRIDKWLWATRSYRQMAVGHPCLQDTDHRGRRLQERTGDDQQRYRKTLAHDQSWRGHPGT